MALIALAESQLNILWALSAAGFFIASWYSLRNYFSTRKISNLWLWLSVSMAVIGTSRVLSILVGRNPLWKEPMGILLLVGTVILLVVLFDFDKEINLCINCSSSTSDLPTEKKKKAQKMLRGF